jgi:hypothetical protein
MMHGRPLIYPVSSRGDPETVTSTLTHADFEKLRSLDTPTVSNAIERFHVRLRNEGFVHGTAQVPVSAPAADAGLCRDRAYPHFLLTD